MKVIINLKVVLEIVNLENNTFVRKNMKTSNCEAFALVLKIRKIGILIIVIKNNNQNIG